ncbi:unnamed protein product, partial [Porites lobata]
MQIRKTRVNSKLLRAVGKIVGRLRFHRIIISHGFSQITPISHGILHGKKIPQIFSQEAVVIGTTDYYLSRTDFVS